MATSVCQRLKICHSFLGKVIPGGVGTGTVDPEDHAGWCTGGAYQFEAPIPNYSIDLNVAGAARYERKFGFGHSAKEA